MAQNLDTLKWESYSQKQQADVWTTDHSRNTQIGWLVQECGVHTLNFRLQHPYSKYLTIWPSRVQVELLQTIHTREIRTRKLVYPSPQERPNTLVLFCHTGCCPWLCQQRPEVLTEYMHFTTLLCNIHWGELEHGAAPSLSILYIYKTMNITYIYYIYAYVC